MFFFMFFLLMLRIGRVRCTTERTLDSPNSVVNSMLVSRMMRCTVRALDSAATIVNSKLMLLGAKRFVYSMTAVDSSDDMVMYSKAFGALGMLLLMGWNTVRALDSAATIVHSKLMLLGAKSFVYTVNAVESPDSVGCSMVLGALSDLDSASLSLGATASTLESL